MHHVVYCRDRPICTVLGLSSMGSLSMAEADGVRITTRPHGKTNGHVTGRRGLRPVGADNTARSALVTVRSK